MKRSIIKILALILIWAVLLVIVALAGTEGNSPVHIVCGTPIYWGILVLVIPWTVATTVLYAVRIHRDWKYKLAHHYPFMDGDIRWTVRNSIVVPILSIFCGIASGFLGVGGGLVAGPIMLELGILPSIAASSAAFQILFTSSSTSIQYILLKRLKWQFAVWFFCIGFIGAIIGQSIVSWALKKYKKQFIVAFLVAFVVAISACGLAATNIITLVKHSDTGGSLWDFAHLCPNVTSS